jgi:hypothetical protein
MKEIKLTQGEVALVDDEDYEYLSQFKWNLFKTKNTKYVFYARGKNLINGKWHNVFMHRLILKPKQDQYIDHIDKNGLNNQKLNLRICTKAQNAWNKKVQDGRKYKGVRERYPFYKYINSKGETVNKIRSKSYQAFIICNKKSIFLGEFKTEIEAAIAYNNGAIKYYGEFANLNKI